VAMPALAAGGLARRSSGCGPNPGAATCDRRATLEAEAAASGLIDEYR